MTLDELIERLCIMRDSYGGDIGDKKVVARKCGVLSEVVEVTTRLNYHKACGDFVEVVIEIGEGE